MKTFFQILFVLCLPFVGMAQGNLQFNQAKFVERISIPRVISGNSIVTDSFNIVVPTGKTLKIEAVTIGRKSYESLYSANTISVCNANISINDGIVLFENNGAHYTNLPMWLPSGSYMVRITSFNAGGNTIKTNISAIEFNITP
jgi:hypothetical protein